ncbi:MAG: HAMP domain-containing sensor histidine kinase [Chitinophagaceae bacterium]
MKLLDKSLRSSLVYASIILLIAIPVMYKVVQAIVKEDVSESLYSKKKKIELTLSSLQDGEELRPFYDPDIQVVPSNAVMKDRLYHVVIYDPETREHVPYQVLEGSIVSGNKIYHVRLQSSLVDREDLIISIVSIIGALIIFVILGLVLINRSLSRRIWKPFYTTLDQLKRFRLDRKSQTEFPSSSIDEFNNLNTTLTTLIDNNQKTFLSQKEFTENASHEMQTPLAVINGNLELLMSSQPLSQEQADWITGIEHATNRMNRLNKTLILLARIDNNQFVGTDKVEIVGSIEHQIHLFEDAINQKRITVTSSLTKPMTRNANPDLIEILFGNIFSNAIRHNRDGGKIIIWQEANSIHICNTGSQQPLDASLLFKRFQKQGGLQESPGLGLALVKRICEISSYDIRYEFASDMHCFSIDFGSSM